jgi:hypothetical protein
VPEPERSAFIAEVVARLGESLRGEQGGWVADYVRLRFRAFRPQAAG